MPDPMKTTQTELFSDNPHTRLNAARSLSPAERKQVQERIGRASPDKPWPFGMPTSFNPYLVILGVSPGGKKVRDKCEPYPLPTVGQVHCGFGGEYTSPPNDWDNRYWKKVRLLCTNLLYSVDDTLTCCDSLALSGHMNLGTRQEGNAKNGVNAKIADRVPDIIVDHLKPRVLILFGFKGLLKQDEIVQNAFRRNVTLAKVESNRPEEVPFKFPCKGQYSFQIWETERPDGGKMTIVLWPNHPSRVPFSNSDAWKASITQANSLLRKRRGD